LNGHQHLLHQHRQAHDPPLPAQRPEEKLHKANGNGSEEKQAHLHTDEEPKGISAAGSKLKRIARAIYNPMSRRDHPFSCELGNDENCKEDGKQKL
jgi:hypothetical protein